MLDLHAVHSVSLTNKVHFLFSHVSDHINLTGKGLRRVSDQIVEAWHSALNKRLTASRYWIKKIESDLHGKMLLRGILQFNSCNLWTMIENWPWNDYLSWKMFILARQCYITILFTFVKKTILIYDNLLKLSNASCSNTINFNIYIICSNKL